MNGPEAAEAYGQAMERAVKRLESDWSLSATNLTRVILALMAELRPLCLEEGVRSQAASTIAALAALAADAAKKDADERGQLALQAASDALDRLRAPPDA